MSQPRVSVVIPTYNCAALLPAAVRSAYAQTLPPYEVVVVDDGSTDDTPAVLESLRAALPSSFVTDRKPNGGEASSRNRGVALAQGDYVAFLDQDDLWARDKLERQIALMLADPGLGLTFSAYTRVSGETRTLVRQEGWTEDADAALLRLMDGCCVTSSTVVVRRGVFDTVGPFDESMWLGNDWDMWVRIAASGQRFGYVPEPLMEYLWHAGNMSRDEFKISTAALRIFEKLFRSDTLSPAVRRVERRCLSRWHMIHALRCLDAGDRPAGRRHFLAAARLRPAAMRPGWVVAYLRAGAPMTTTRRRE